MDKKSKKVMDDLQNKYEFLRSVRFSCGDGWLPILEDLFGKIDKEVKHASLTGFKVQQVKEKFAGLIVYVEGGNEIIDDLIALASRKAAETCEDCGNLGRRRTLNKGNPDEWLRTECDDCFAISPYRVTDAYALAVEVIGSAENTRRWLLAPHFSLEGKAPLEMLKTDEGAKEVEDLLGRIKHGMCL